MKRYALVCVSYYTALELQFLLFYNKKITNFDAL